MFKHLSCFGQETCKNNPVIEEEVKKILNDFRNKGKPIGFCSHAAVLALGIEGTSEKVKISLGKKLEDDDTLHPITELPINRYIGIVVDKGLEHVEKDMDEVCVDSVNKIASIPTFHSPNANNFHQVQNGVKKMIEKIAEMMKEIPK